MKKNVEYVFSNIGDAVARCVVTSHITVTIVVDFRQA